MSFGSKWLLLGLLGGAACSGSDVTCSTDQRLCAGACQPAGQVCVEDGLSLVDLVPSVGVLKPAFSPSQLEYTVQVPSWLNRVSLTPTLSQAAGGAQVSAFQTPSGQESPAVSLLPGTTRIPVTVASALGGMPQYSVLAQISQPPVRYMKAAVPGRDFLYGDAVALDGDTLVVGVPQEYDVAAENGAVYVYRSDGNTWRLEARLTAGSGSANWFGKSVAVSGDRVAVGIPWYGGSGRVMTFTRTGTTWQREAVLRPQYSSYEDYFGMRLSLSGDGLAVAVPNNASRMGGINPDPSNTEMPRSGAVVVFRIQGVSWEQEAFIKAPYPDAEDDFGSALALSGNELVVGMQHESSSARGVGGNGADNSALRSGAAYVYSRQNAAWRLTSYIKSSNSDAEDRFGCAVALAGGTLAISACGESSRASGIGGDQTDNSALEAGAVYLFGRSGDTWAQQAYVKAAYSGDGDLFGSSLSLSGDGSVLAVGVVAEAGLSLGPNTRPYDRSATNSGAAYVYRRVRGRFVQEAYLKAPNAGLGDRYGKSIAVSPDATTLVIGAPGEASAFGGIDGDGTDNSAYQSGAAYLYR